MKDLSVVIPIFRENHKNLKTLVRNLRKRKAEVIVVDDGSENPYPGAVVHENNQGYGAALLTGIKKAKREIIMTLDGDGQHRFQDVQNMYKVWKMINVDMLVGTRRLKEEIWYRFLGRKFLNWTASLFALQWLSDLNSGMRMFKRKIVLGYESILCKQFSFTTSLTMSMLCDNYVVEWFPIRVLSREKGKSKVNVWKHGWITLYYILRIGLALRTRKLREHWRNLKDQFLR